MFGLQLTKKLCSGPVLSYPQLDRKFFLQTDASDQGLGAILAQKDSQGNEHVVAYASRTLSDREKHFFYHGARSFSHCLCYLNLSSLSSGPALSFDN